MKAGSMVFLVTLVALLAAGPPMAAAQTYLGEVCWSVLETENESGPTSKSPGVLRAGVTTIGAGYYFLQGHVTTADNPFFLHATGVIVGTEIWITGSDAQDHTPTKPYRDGGVMQVRLSPSNLSGTWWDVYSSFKTTDRSLSPGYGAGTATLIACP